MKKYTNGKYIEMTPAEIAAMQEEAAQAEAEEKHRHLSFYEVQEMLVRQQINNLVVDDTTALRMVEYYPVPDAASYAAGDRIQYNGNMALQSGKYYTQNNILYLCNRDTVNPVYNALAELVGLYVEVG